MLSHILALLMVLGCMIGLQVLVMIYGWGLEPQSWWWIVGGGLVGMVFLNLVGKKVLKEGDREAKEE